MTRLSNAASAVLTALRALKAAAAKEQDKQPAHASTRAQLVHGPGCDAQRFVYTGAEVSSDAERRQR